MQTTTQQRTNALAGPSGTSPTVPSFHTSKAATVVDGENDDDDLSSLPDEYKQDKDDSEEDAVVARSTWKGKERMIIHSDSDDDDDDDDVYQEQQEEKYKRERQREKEKSVHREQRIRQSHAAHQFQHEKLFGGGLHREGSAKKKSHRRKCNKNKRRNRPLELDEEEESSDDEPSLGPLSHPGIIAAPDKSNDVPLPEGVDPKNVEDIFLGLGSVPVPAEWSDDEDEGMLFQALDAWRDSDDDMDAGSEGSDSSNGTSDTDMLGDDEDDDAFDAAFGLGESEMPFVVMEDWSGNLVFAQPRISGDGEEDRPSNSRSTSASNRGKEKRSRKGSATESTTNGEGPVLLVDEGFEEFDENVFDGDAYDGDTTDSLPDEDMPSPPNLMSFSTHVGGVEANNAAAFGVTTVDEAALARDLGVPLADARNLLERARAEEQQQLLGGVSNLSMTANEDTILEASPVDGISAVDMSANGSMQTLLMDNPGISTSSTVTTPSTNIEVSPHPAHAVPGLSSTQSTPPTVAPGFPVMGAFLPEHEHPDRVAVIDGTGKVTPSPFMRRGGPRGRARGGSQTGAKGSNVKRQALGASPSVNGRRPRYSSVPAGRGHVSDSARGSPLRLAQRESFDGEDTSSDHEDMAEPISLDDVLDTSALHHHAHESDHNEEIYGSRHLRSLRRWEKVPITTFRRSRNSNAPFTSSTGLFAADGSNPAPGFPHSSGAILRPSFASPSIATTLAMDSSTAYPVSPILEATNQDGRNGKNNRDKRGGGKEAKKSKKQDQRKTARNGGLMRNRTSSAGSMPPLRLS